MRIHQMSDLHLEFNTKFRVTNPCDADLLMLNGDIFVADYFVRSKDSPKFFLAEAALDFFTKASESYPYVIYVLGNHEHYHGTYIETADRIKSALAKFNNVFVLDNESVRLGDYKIIGTTLWTDCEDANPIILDYLRSYLNDFKIVNYSNNPWKRFLPIDSVVAHRSALKFIARESEGEDNVIVMTHHAPSYKSIHSSYQNPMYHYSNRGYFSELDEFILDRRQIKLWTHGHVHNNFDYMIGNTRIVCNPHGYGTENIHGFNREHIIHA